MLTNVKKYLDTVCEQIRFQKAHDTIKKELQDHITDQAETFMQEGITEQKAYELAVCEMGDPVIVGTELDRIHRPKLQWSFVVFISLFLIGNIITKWTIWKASTATGYTTDNIGINNILAIVVGFAVMVIFYYIDFTILAHHSKMIYAIYVVILALVSVLWNLFGTYAAASIGIDIFTFFIVAPPLIYIFPVILTALLYDCRGKSYGTILLCGTSFLLPAIFSINMRMSTNIFIIAVINFILIITAICRNWFKVNKTKVLLMIFVITVLFLLFVYFSMPEHILHRFYIGIKEPYEQDYAKNILQHNVKGANLFGEGNSLSFYGASGRLIKMTPENSFFGIEYYTNYALHYFGWVAFLLFLAIYLFFIVRGFILAHKQKSQLGSMVAFAILLTISITAIWNIVCTSGYFIYVNPLQLPFFSSGGTTNIIYFILMGILLSVFRTGKYVKDNKTKFDIKQSFFKLKNDELTFTIRLKK